MIAEGLVFGCFFLGVFIFAGLLIVANAIRYKEDIKIKLSPAIITVETNDKGEDK